MLVLFAVALVPWRKKTVAIVPSKDLSIRVVSVEYGIPDPKNVTISLEWISRAIYRLSIGESLPGTSLHFLGMKRRGELYASFINESEREVAIKENWTVELPPWCLR